MLRFMFILSLIVRQPVDEPKLFWREMQDNNVRLAQSLLVDKWAVKVTTGWPILLKYECNLSWLDSNLQNCKEFYEVSK